MRAPHISMPLQNHSSPTAHARDNRKKALPISHRPNRPSAPSTVRVDSKFFSARKTVKSSKKPWSEKIQEVQAEQWKSHWRVMGTAGIEEARKRRRSTLAMKSQQERRSRSFSVSPEPQLSGTPLNTSILDTKYSPSHKRLKTTDSKTDPLSSSITESSLYNPSYSDLTPELSLSSSNHGSSSFPASSSASPNAAVALTTAHLNPLPGHPALVVPTTSSPTQNSPSPPTTNSCGDALPPKMKRKGVTQ
ncbi:hypothetical protein Moror_12668 [Moniliophthora roreri MCA 2997]|uniref:Uncharacterized protein n=2 Tax=Moniliophthora roreri TaxID=221103 RepID=V2YV87_MONRO|nr:hypothetical protein Moror_12668 [Moniliophthora roreri MCA 2997]KAI3615625.1 hypothetical protein WG66_011799 [Moniliophthora roreri]